MITDEELAGQRGSPWRCQPLSPGFDSSRNGAAGAGGERG